MNETKECPVLGCNSKGHVSSKHIKHSLIYECPLFHNLTPNQCKNLFNIRSDVVTNIKRSYDYYDSLLGWDLGEKELEDQRQIRDKKLSLSFDREPLLEGYSTANILMFFRKAQVLVGNIPLATEQLSEKITEMAKEERGAKEFCLQNLQLGDWLLSVPFEAPLPAHVAYNRLIYCCEFCFKLNVDLSAFRRHVTKCQLHPPGDEIYRKDSLSVFEVDGNKCRMFCQNLCIVGKMFISNKTLLYDVAPFKFYILTLADEGGCHFVGYFSKEKTSELNYNLSCIFVAPQYQKSGYGRFLIDLSYALSRAEKMTGTPEKPISDLGLIAYRSYWRGKLVEFLKKRGKVRQFSIFEMSSSTGIAEKDLVDTLLEMRLIKCEGEKRVILCSESKLEKFCRSKKNLFDEECLKLSS